MATKKRLSGSARLPDGQARLAGRPPYGRSPVSLRDISRRETGRQARRGGGVGITPLSDRVLIREIKSEGEERKSGIIIPETVNEDRGAKKGEVVAVGVGRTEEGKLVPMNVRPGQKVLFQWGDRIKIGDDEYHVVRESEILAILK